jgi:hypothetical protein
MAIGVESTGSSEEIEAPVGVSQSDAVRVVHDHADRIFTWNYER